MCVGKCPYITLSVDAARKRPLRLSDLSRRSYKAATFCVRISNPSTNQCSYLVITCVPGRHPLYQLSFSEQAKNVNLMRPMYVCMCVCIDV